MHGLANDLFDIGLILLVAGMIRCLWVCRTQYSYDRYRDRVERGDTGWNLVLGYITMVWFLIAVNINNRRAKRAENKVWDQALSTRRPHRSKYWE